MWTYIICISLSSSSITTLGLRLLVVVRDVFLVVSIAAAAALGDGLEARVEVRRVDMTEDEDGNEGP